MTTDSDWILESGLILLQPLVLFALFVLLFVFIKAFIIICNHILFLCNQILYIITLLNRLVYSVRFYTPGYRLGIVYLGLKFTGNYYFVF